MLLPRQKPPDFKVPPLDHGTFDLAAETSDRGTVICFYRGLHCPICATYLAELKKRVPDFAERGVGMIAISSNTEECARALSDKIENDGMQFAYGVTLQSA